MAICNVYKHIFQADFLTVSRFSSLIYFDVTSYSYQNTDRQHAACNFTTCNSIDNPKRRNDENINNSNISKYKEKHTNKRRQSDVSSSPQQNPIRGEACYFDRYRHRSDNDTKSRRFVLNASSKVPIEVRRNHSGSNSLSLY